MRFLFLVVLGYCAVLHAKPLEISVKAKSAILINAKTGAVLFEKEAYKPSFPASTTKIATALYVLGRESDLARSVSVSSESLKMKPQRGGWSSVPSYWNEWDGTKMGLQKGELLSIESLLHGLMLASGNDAANVLAEAVSGSVSDFLDGLNGYLVELGCRTTHFMNPHGLHHEEHVTSAYDLALITKRALQFPKFREIVSTLDYAKPKTNKQPQVSIRQKNALLLPTSRYFYPKAIGVKTGFTSMAQNTLVAAAQDQGRVLIAVLLGCEKREDRYLDAKRLFEAAFSEVKMKRVYFERGAAYKKMVEGAKEPLIGYLEEEAAVEFYPAEEAEVKAHLYWEIPSFPIRKDQKVGEMRFTDADSNEVARITMLAREDVKATLFFSIKEKWRSLFR